MRAGVVGAAAGADAGAGGGDEGAAGRLDLQGRLNLHDPARRPHRSNRLMQLTRLCLEGKGRSCVCAFHCARTAIVFVRSCARAAVVWVHFLHSIALLCKDDSRVCTSSARTAVVPV